MNLEINKRVTLRRSNFVARCLCIAIVMSCYGIWICPADAVVTSESEEQPPAKKLTLGEALRLTVQNSPDILEVDADLADKLARATESQLPPNPEITAQYFPEEDELRALGASNGYDFTASQEFRLSHLGMRQVYAAAMKDVSRMEYQAEIIRVLNETVLLYYRAWMLDQLQSLLTEAQSQAKEITERIAIAIERNETPSTKGNLFQAEVARFEAEIAATEAEQELAELELLRATGLPRQALKLAPPVLRKIPEDTFVLLEFSQNRASLRRQVQARQRVARRRNEVAHLDIFPTLTATFLASTDTDFGEPEYGGGVGMRIPVWDWNQAERKRARAAQEQAEAEVKSLDRLSFDRYVTAHQKRAIALHQRSDTYWNQVIPAYKQAYELSRHMFNQGQVNMVQLWEVQQSLVRATDEALQSTAEALTARTLLEQTIGGKIEELPPTPNKSKSSLKEKP